VLRDACLAKAHELNMGIVAMKVLGGGMLGGFGRKDVEKLPGAACRYVLQDDRIHMLVIGMRVPKEIDANVKTFSGDITFTNEDRGLLAGVSAAILSRLNQSVAGRRPPSLCLTFRPRAGNGIY